MRWTSRYQLVYLACVSNPRLPKCKPSMWLGNLMAPVTISNRNRAMLCQQLEPAENLTQLRGFLSFIWGTTSNIGSINCSLADHFIHGERGKDCSKALGKGRRHTLLRGRMSVGKEKGKQQKSNAARMEKQQGQKQYWPAVFSLSRVDQRGFFFSSLHSFGFPLKAEKSSKGNFVFNKWRQKSLEKNSLGEKKNSWGMVVSMGKKNTTKENTFLKN